jgi:IS30 family transposase
MGQIYSQLTKEDRHLIATLVRRKLTRIEIALEIGCSERTVRRELKRGVSAGREYNATDAHQKKLARRKRSKYLGMKIDAHAELEAFIVAALKQKQRPEAIAGRIRSFHPELPAITAKSIYNWLYAPQGQRYAHLLPSRRYKPKKRGVPRTKRETIPDRTPLSARPAGATNRTRYGHTASDTMVSGRKTGSKAAIAGTVERKLRYVRLTKLSDLKPETMNEGLRRNFHGMGIAVYTDTKDNGIENKGHKEIEAVLGITSYFCDPYSSWQKGEIEKVFQMVRAEGIPKGMDLGLVSGRRLKAIQDTLNNRWRKSIGYHSATELMEKRRRYETNELTKKRIAAAMRYTSTITLKTTEREPDT